MTPELRCYFWIRMAAIRNKPSLQRFFQRYHDKVMAIDLGRLHPYVAKYPSHQRIIAYQEKHK